MLEQILDVISPHCCCSCGEIGDILCQYCRYNIMQEYSARCIVCQKLSLTGAGKCCIRTLPYKKAWYADYRQEAVKRLIDLYKFHRAKRASIVLAQLLDDALPILPDDVVVTPVPTIARHIRVRGYGHAELMSKELARIRGLSYDEALSRRTQTTQLGSSRKERRAQAERAFRCNSIENKIYLLIDDIFTTGATAEFASKCLLDAGAKEVWLAVVARQPIDKKTSPGR